LLTGADWYCEREGSKEFRKPTKKRGNGGRRRVGGKGLILSGRKRRVLGSLKRKVVPNKEAKNKPISNRRGGDTQAQKL